MQNFLGRDGFVWWVGVVEDVMDPDVLGRCRVRVFGYHDNTSQIPTADLPWATAIHSPNTPNLYSPLAVGDWVFGFFLDSNNAQEPAIVGLIPTIKNPRNFNRVATKLNKTKSTCWEIGNNYFEIINDSVNGYIELYHSKGSKLNFDSDKNINAYSVANTYISAETSIVESANSDIYLIARKNIRGSSNNAYFVSNGKFDVSAQESFSLSIGGVSSGIGTTTGGSSLFPYFVNTTTTANTSGIGASSINANEDSITIETKDFLVESNTFLVTSDESISLETSNVSITSDDLSAQSNTVSIEGSVSVSVTGEEVNLESATDIGLVTANNSVSVDTLVAWIRAVANTANSAANTANSAANTANSAVNRLNNPTYGVANGVTVIVGI